TFASYSMDGRQLAYNRHPAPWTRKHYRGSYAADLWLCDLESKTSRKLLDANRPDDEKPSNFWPMFGKDGLYSVSDREVTAKAGRSRSRSTSPPTPGRTTWSRRRSAARRTPTTCRRPASGR